MPVDEQLLRLVQGDTVEPLAGGRQAHDEHPALGEQPAQVEADAAEVDLGLLAERVVLRHRHLPDGHGPASPCLAHVAPHGRLTDVGTVLLDQALPDPPGRVALLLRRVAVGLEPSIDRRLPRVQHRRDAGGTRLAWGRDRRRQRLSHCPPMSVKRRASPRTDRPSRSRAFRICSNNSTFDLVAMNHTVEPAIAPMVDPRPHEDPPGWGLSSVARPTRQ